MQRLIRETADDRLFGQSGKGHEGRLRNVELVSGVHNLIFIADGGGTILPVGIAGDLPVGFDCIIQAWSMVCDPAASVQLDIWKVAFASFPPTVVDSITGSAVPTITADDHDSSNVLTGWTIDVKAGDVFRFHIDSNTVATRLAIKLDLQQ